MPGLCSARAFSVCGEWGLLLVVALRLLHLAVSFEWSTGSGLEGFSSCGSLTVERWLSSCGAYCSGLSCSRHVGSSRTGDRTRVPSIGRWILNHREVPQNVFYNDFSLLNLGSYVAFGCVSESLSSIVFGN